MQPHDWSCVATWQSSALRIPLLPPAPSLLPTAYCLLPLPAFSVSNFPRLLLLRLSLTGWLCDAKFGLCMWPSRWPRAQTTIKLSTAFALATASNFPIVVQHRIATPRHARPCHDGQWRKRNLFSVPRAMTACLLSPENRVNFCPMQEILNYFSDGISLDYDRMG